MKITAEPRSDQWNADDFVGGARTFTIAGVKVGKAEQKYDIELVEGEGRAWRPPLTMLRLLIAAWGDEAQQWVGRRVTLYRDESIRFGPEAVGGIRVSHMSDLPGGKAFEVRLTSSRGKRATVHVEPLSDDAPTATPETDGGTISATQSKKMFAQFGELGIKDRDLGLAYMTDVLGREVESSKTLSKQEASQIIESQIADLEARQDNNE